MTDAQLAAMSAAEAIDAFGGKKDAQGRVIQWPRTLSWTRWRLVQERLRMHPMMEELSTQMLDLARLTLLWTLQERARRRDATDAD